MKTIALFLPDLRGGGAERVFMTLAHAFRDKGYRIEFVLMQAKGELIKEVPEGVKIIDFGVTRIRNAIKPLINYLRDERPDVLLVGMWPLTTIAVFAHRLAGTSGRIILSDHNTLSLSPLSNGWHRRLFIYLSMRFFYPQADQCVAVSSGVANDVAALGGLRRESICVINNPIFVDKTPDQLLSRSFWDGITGKRILAVGSFKDQKDHESLIRAFAKLQNSLSATLVIVGEGPLRPKLEDLIAELSLEKSVKLPGFFANPYLWYRDADLFVLSSLYEGFGNVIVEALECGVPVVSTDCLSGPREILEDGKYGRLVPVGDVDALAAGMYNSLHESVDHALLEKRAKDFSVDIISSQYLNVMFPSR